MDLLKITTIGLFFGTFGTTLGGIIGSLINTKTNKLLSFVLEFAAGLMMAIISFDLLPEAMNLSNIINVLLGIFFGIIVMIICEMIIKKITIKKTENNYIEKNKTLLNTGIIIAIGLALHNFPEGLAIGSGFGSSIKLGYSLAIAIAIHDIPEGISMSVPMKAGGMKISKVILYTILSGVTTGIGAFFGGIIGTISQELISVCLAFAAGAMLYIVSGELIPESKKIYKGRFSTLGNILGFILGIVSTQINI